MKKVFIIAIMVLVFSSCGIRKNFAYLQDMLPEESYPIKESKELLIKCNDRLSIVVTCNEPTLAKVFNIQGMFNITPDGNIDGNTTEMKPLNERGYKVDREGNIDFPELGKIHLAGLTIPQAVDLIETKISEAGYIKDPMVIIEILNFKYTILGATGRGVFVAEDGEITLLQAIAKAGDVNDLGRLDRVAVIREENGVRKIYLHDLRKKDIFDSPCYYLQQNDIIYVEPKYRMRSKSERGMQVASVIIGFVTTLSTITTTLLLIKNNK